MSASSLLLYTSLGPLLRQWRRLRGVSQEQFAEKLAVSDRQARRWETSRHEVSTENLNDIAQFTRIPMPVLLALNVQQPIYYCCRKRKYSYSATENAGIATPSLLATLPDEMGVIGSLTSIKSVEQVALTLEYDHDIYATPNPVSAEVVLAAAQRLPELNLFCKDHWGHYAGHLVCFPLGPHTYKDLRTQARQEGDLAESAIISPHNGGPVVYYMYSIYACHSAFGYIVLRAAAAYLKEVNRAANSIIAGYAVTQEGIDLCEQLGMREVYSSPTEREALGTEVTPVLFEVYLRVLYRSLGRIGRRHRQGYRDVP